MRLMLATSPDGLTWTRTGTTLSDRADVPSSIVVDGRLWVIYIMASDAVRSPDLLDAVVAAHSSDLTSWTYKKLSFAGSVAAGFRNHPVDPSIVAISGGYRLYFTLFPEDPRSTTLRPHTFSATSSDLLHWTHEGERFTAPGNDVLDPSVLFVGTHYELFAGGAMGNHHATSTDGLGFTTLGPFAPLTESNATVIMANGARMGSRYRYYGFTQLREGLPSDIRSLRYASASWGLEPGARLALDATSRSESGFVKDPAVSAHPQGEARGYVMVYVTRIP